MKKPKIRKSKVFQNVWDKYRDTLWRIEQSWNDNLDYTKRVALTDSVIEMVHIEKKLKAIEARATKG